MASVHQEWYCTKSGGGCGGFITCKINDAIQGVVEMICPKCGHKHQRYIDRGLITEQLRHSGSPTQEICPTIAAWSDKPRVMDFKNTHGSLEKERDGVRIPASSFLADRRAEIHGAPNAVIRA